MSEGNVLEYAEIFMRLLDEQVIQESVTGWMDSNAGEVEYNGGKVVHVPKITMDGLGDYSRKNGYPDGSVNLEYEDLTMTQDRGKKFTLDDQDVNETNFVANATRVMGTFQTQHVIPEVDAYRNSKIATAALTANEHVEYNYTPSKSDIVDALIDAVMAVRKAGFRKMPLVIEATSDVVGALDKAKSDKAGTATFMVKEGLEIDVPTITIGGNGVVPIIEVDDDRMVSAIKTGANGFTKGVSALDINFMVMPRRAPIAITKANKPKIFTPEQNQGADGYLIEYRRYHDLWILENQIPGIAVNFKDAAPHGATGAGA